MRESEIKDGGRDSKKGHGILRGGSVVERYRFILAECAMYPIQMLCSVMNYPNLGFMTGKDDPKRIKTDSLWT